MRKYILTICFIFIVAAFSYAQKEGSALIDSLVKELPAKKDDSQKVKLLAAISFDYYRIDPEKGIEYGKEALQLAQKVKWPKGTALAYKNIGVNYNTKGDISGGLENFTRAREIFERINDSASVARILHNMAIAYSDLDELPKAIQYDSLSLNMYRNLHDQEGIMLATEGLGSSYMQTGKYEQALEDFNEEYDLAVHLGLQDMVLMAFGNIGAVSQLQHNYSKALYYNFKALAMSREMGLKQDEARAAGNIGEGYYLIVKDSGRNSVPDSLISGSNSINLGKAENFLSLAIEIDKELGDRYDLIAFYQDLSETQEAEGKYKEALLSYKQCQMYNDSIANDDVRLKVASLETKRESELREKQIEINKLTLKHVQAERLWFIAGLVMLAAVIGVVYNNYKNQRKTSALRATSLQQKDMLMKEIHHRVKNNLQVISTLLDLQLVNITDDHAKDAITESTTRLKAISLIHQQLYQDEHITTIECAQFAKDLHAQISAVFSKPGQQVTFNNNIPKTILDIDTAVPIGLILNELMTNSYKYAFSGREGSIEVHMSKGANGYTLIYSDSGPGLPDNLDMKKIKSLGMKIITRLSKQLGGAFDYKKNSNSFIITFIDIEGRKMID